MSSKHNLSTTRTEDPPREKEEVDQGLSLHHHTSARPGIIPAPSHFSSVDGSSQRMEPCGREMCSTIGHQALSGFRAKLISLPEMLIVVILNLRVITTLEVVDQITCISDIYIMIQNSKIFIAWR